MYLETVRIENFKSITDTGVFTLAPVTCLVGKNESGKTAILEALYKLNPVYPAEADYSDVIEYPRRNWSEYSLERRGLSPDNVVTTTWRLEEADRAALESLFGLPDVVSEQVIVKKGYSNQQQWSIALDEQRLVNHLLAESGLHEEELDGLSTLGAVSALFAALNEAESPSERHQSFLAHLGTIFKDQDATKAARQLLDRRMPKFLFVPEYNAMPGKVALDDIQHRIQVNDLGPRDRVFLALMRLAGRTVDEIREIGQFEELIAELEAVSNRISDELFRYWTQNRHLEVQFRFDNALPEDPAPFNSGKVFRTRIRNNQHKASVDFDERSTGFVWFFSFLAWFSQLKAEYGDNLVILLDEPGLGLHAKPRFRTLTVE